MDLEGLNDIQIRMGINTVKNLLNLHQMSPKLFVNASVQYLVTEKRAEMQFLHFPTFPDNSRRPRQFPTVGTGRGKSVPLLGGLPKQFLVLHKPKLQYIIQMKR